ncbi:MAG TPA: hypothetical protein VIX17_28765 [Pyrinomonadaceae bacterium]
MSRRLAQFLIFSLTLLLGVSVHFHSLNRPTETALVKPAPAASASRSNEILRVLLPNGNSADETRLPEFDRIEAIDALKEAQRDARGDRAVGIVFLLAVLKEDYQTNRAKLIESLRGCQQLSYPQKQECAYSISSYLMELARQGDMSLLTEIFSVHDLSDGDFSEELGYFYSNTLNKYPRAFLSALSFYPNDLQQRVCTMAEMEDGGGMADETYFEVRKLLKTLSVQKDSLAPVATNCLHAMRQARIETLRQRED